MECNEAGRGVLVWRAADRQIDVVLTPLRDDEWLYVLFRELPGPLRWENFFGPRERNRTSGGTSGTTAVPNKQAFGDGSGCAPCMMRLRNSRLNITLENRLGDFEARNGNVLCLACHAFAVS